MTQENPTAPTETTEVTTNDAGGATATVDPQAAADAEAAKAAEGDLLAGKFKSPEDLERAYVELQKKLGGVKEDAETPETAKEDAEEKEEEQGGDELETEYGSAVASALKEADIDVKAAVASFEKDGTLSEDDFSKFEKVGYSRSMVEAYLRGVTSQQTEVVTAEQQVAEIKQAVGGDEALAKLQQYIGNAFTADEVKAYNDALSSGDFNKAKEAVEGAKARYDSAFGAEAAPLGGKSAQASAGYASESEMHADMAKPEYKTSEAFRQKVEAKIMASTFFVTR